VIDQWSPLQQCSAATLDDRLRDLVALVATGDRQAFRRLVTFLTPRVRTAAAEALPHQDDVSAVTRSTFVEVWHMAGHHLRDPGTGTSTWVLMIAGRHRDDRLRACGTPPVLGDAHDGHTFCELSALTGARPGHDPIRPPEHGDAW
jgi:DNA-directed RNA polymerase specialized sigma24 family protein